MTGDGGAVRWWLHGVAVWGAVVCGWRVCGWRVRGWRVVHGPLILQALLLAACSTSEPAPKSELGAAPSSVAAHLPSAPPRLLPPPSCKEVPGNAWARAAPGDRGVARAHDQRLLQTLEDGSAVELAFVGAHAFDVLDKLMHEVNRDDERRRAACHLLNDAAERGAQVLRIWGSLKRTGTDDELVKSHRMLGLLLDENDRRSRPLRFIVTLLNHQAGYGAPAPERSLDDQAPGPWHSRKLYLEGGWDATGVGALGARIRGLGADAAMATPHVIAWELVNELDTFRHVAGGRFEGPDADTLRDRFLVPAATALARGLPQAVMLGDLRGHREAYAGWAPGVIAALPRSVRDRLVWTSHVYAELGRPAEDYLHKLDVDVAIAREHRLPLVLGELGQHVPGAHARFCGEGVVHDLAPLLGAVKKRALRALVIWGEGRCKLEIGAGRWMSIGAGSDSAEISSADRATASLLRETREGWAR